MTNIIFCLFCSNSTLIKNKVFFRIFDTDNVYIGSKSYQTRVLQLSTITLIKADDKKDQRNDRHIIFIHFFSLSHYYYYYHQYYYYYSQTVNRNFAALRFN